jgi:ribosome maturation factor RimP
VSLTLTKAISEEQSQDFPKSMRNNLKLKTKLLGISEEKIKVEVKDIVLEIPFEQIKRANLETNLNK